MTTSERYLVAVGVLRRKGHALGEEALKAEWLAVDRTKAREERPLLAAARRLFDEQEREVLARLPEDLFGGSRLHGAHPERFKVPFAVSRILDVARWKEAVVRTFAPLVVAVIEAGFTNGLSRVGMSGVDFTSGSPAVRVVLREVLLRSSLIVDTTADELARLIQRSLEEGRTAEEIAAEVRTQFREWKQWRATLIARTATTAGFEAGQQEAFREAGVERKAWLSQRDPRTRESHFSIDGEEVRLDQVFGNGLMYPGDPAGAPSETIQCRCTLLPIIAEGKGRAPGRTDRQPIDTSEMNEREQQRVQLSLRDLAIRRDHAAGIKNLSTLAEKYNCSESTVRRAIWGA